MQYYNQFTSTFKYGSQYIINKLERLTLSELIEER